MSNEFNLEIKANEFIEIECIKKDNLTKEDLTKEDLSKQLNEYKTKFEIKEDELISESYSDLLLK